MGVRGNIPQVPPSHSFVPGYSAPKVRLQDARVLGLSEGVPSHDLLAEFRTVTMSERFMSIFMTSHATTVIPFSQDLADHLLHPLLMAPSSRAGSSARRDRGPGRRGPGLTSSRWSPPASGTAPVRARGRARALLDCCFPAGQHEGNRKRHLRRTSQIPSFAPPSHFSRTVGWRWYPTSKVRRTPRVVRRLYSRGPC